MHISYAVTELDSIALSIYFMLPLLKPERFK